MSRIITDWKIFPKGIAADDRTAVCVDGLGMATVLGSSKAYFIQTDAGRLPEVCEAGRPLQWNANKKALKVYQIEGANEGNGSFHVSEFKSGQAKGGKWYWWWVENGVLKTEEALNRSIRQL